MAIRKPWTIYRERSRGRGGLGARSGSGFVEAFAEHPGASVSLAEVMITGEARAASGFGDASDLHQLEGFRSGLTDLLEVGQYLGGSVEDTDTRPAGLVKIVGIERADRRLKVWAEEVLD